MRPIARPKNFILPLLGAILIAGGCGEDDVERRTIQRPRTAPNPGVNAVVAKENQLLNVLVSNPNDVDARLLLAHLYFDTNRPAQAIPAYEAVLQVRPDDPDIRSDLGSCYQQTRQLDKAQAEFERVIKTNPQHWKAAYNLAVVLELKGQLEAAALQWDRAAQICTDPSIAEKARQHAAMARQRAGK